MLKEQLQVCDGLQRIEPPEEAERAKKIYGLVRAYGEAHWFAIFFGTFGGMIATIVICGLWLPNTVVPALANSLGMDPKVVAFSGGMGVAALGAIVGLFTVRPLYLRWEKSRVWAELDDLLARPGTPRLLEQIAQVDSRFRESIPVLLKIAVTD